MRRVSGLNGVLFSKESAVNQKLPLLHVFKPRSWLSQFNPWKSFAVV